MESIALSIDLSPLALSTIFTFLFGLSSFGGPTKEPTERSVCCCECSVTFIFNFVSSATSYSCWRNVSIDCLLNDFVCMDYIVDFIFFCFGSVDLLWRARRISSYFILWVTIYLFLVCETLILKPFELGMVSELFRLWTTGPAGIRLSFRRSYVLNCTFFSDGALDGFSF